MNDALNENLEVLENNNNNIFELCSSRKLVPSDILSVRVKQPNENAMLRNSPPFRPGGRASRQLVKAIEMSLADKTVPSDVDGNEPQFVIYMGENPCFAKLILRTAGSVLIEPMHPDPLDNCILQPWNGHVKIVEGNDVYQVQMRREQNGWKVTDSLRLRGILSSFLSKYKLSSLPSNLGNVKCLNNSYDDSGPSDPFDMMSLDDGSDDCNSTESSLFSMLKNNSSSLKDNFNYPINQCSQKVATKPEHSCFSPTSNDKLNYKMEMSRQLSNEHDINKNRRNGIKFSHQPFRSTIVRTPSPQPQVSNNSHSLSATTVALESPPVMKSDELHQNMLAIKRKNTFNYSKYDMGDCNNNTNDNKNNVPTDKPSHRTDRHSPMSHHSCTEFIDSDSTIIISTNPKVTEQQQHSSTTYAECQHPPLPSSSLDVANLSRGGSAFHTSNHSTATLTVPIINEQFGGGSSSSYEDNTINSMKSVDVTTATIGPSVIHDSNESTSTTDDTEMSLKYSSATTDDRLTHEMLAVGSEDLSVPALRPLIGNRQQLNIDDRYSDDPSIALSPLEIDDRNNGMIISEESLHRLNDRNDIISNITATTTTTANEEVVANAWDDVTDKKCPSIVTDLTTTSSSSSFCDIFLNEVSESNQSDQRIPSSSSASSVNNDMHNLPITTINELNSANDALLTTPNTDRVLSSILIPVDSEVAGGAGGGGGIGKKRKRKLDIDFNISPYSYSSDESAGQMPPRPPRASTMRTHADRKLGVTSNASSSPSSPPPLPSTVTVTVTTSTLSAGISLPPRPPPSSKKRGAKGLDSTATTAEVTGNSGGRSCRESAETETELEPAPAPAAEPAVRSSSRKRSSISPMQRDAIFGQWVSRYQSASSGSWQL